MEDINSPVFAQAKIEYTKQLIDILKIPIYDGLQHIYSDSKQTYDSSYGPELPQELPSIFRKNIENVPKWNVDMIDNEVDRIMRISNCDWLEDLITAVFISHTKILASLGNNSKRVNLTIPKSSSFIHKCYINSAREIWKNPYLFDENVSSSEYQKNIKYIEDLIEKSIEQTIRKALPVKEILRDHFEHNDMGNTDKDRYEMDKTKNLQKILMNEIMNARKEKEDFINKIDDINNEKGFDDHVDENMIKENTSNLEINDILSDNEDNDEDDFIEPKYENPNIMDLPIVMDTPITIEEKLNEFKGIVDENKEKIGGVVVKKIDIVKDIIKDDMIIKDDIIKDDILNDIKNIVAVEQINEIMKDKEEIKEIKEIKEETLTLDNFMNDVNDLLTDKKENKDDFTLFNDAKEIES